MADRRSYGTGSLIERPDSTGRVYWYGKWRSQGRQVMRKIGPKRGGNVREGYTRPQAEAELRRLMAETTVTPAVGELLTVQEVSARYLANAERRGRKPSTRKNIESVTRIHLTPFFGARSLDAIRPEDVLDLVAVLERRASSRRRSARSSRRSLRCSTSPRRRSAAGRLGTRARAWSCGRSQTSLRSGS